MIFVRPAVLVLLVFTLTLTAQEPPARAVALTFDDLPYASQAGVGTLADARRVTDALLSALERAGAPAVGFVNESKLDVEGEREARTALLARWVEAGAVLGNHTYGHVDLNAVTVEAFQDDIVRGEPTVDRLMAGRAAGARFFRHPQTHTGDTAEKKAAVESFLKARGYTIAPHTIDSVDYLFDRAYAAARRSSDDTLPRRVRDAYVAFVLDATAFAEQAAAKIFGREVPQTLLLHASDLNAETLDALVGGLRARGYGFIRLEDAMRDPAYQTPDTLVTKFGPTWLWRWNRSLEKKVSFREDPAPPEWVQALAR